MTREQAINSLITHGFSVEQVGEIIEAVTPQLSSELEKNSKKLENSTTKNNLGVEEVTALAEWISKLTEECEVAYNKGYADGTKDQELILDKIDEIITDALDKSTDQKESQTLRWVLDKISEVT